eukprot:TRINITY_DN75812_c0_g1_i1.p1 TRINITY_DN75812_c0_g1~~TRINITY_DN75812_c0_g1_i1.p1  ORF type:complete len:239 (+),score=7.03 TRINITY_DN75812_c0_g1_i1:57-773(+)
MPGMGPGLWPYRKSFRPRVYGPKRGPKYAPISPQLAQTRRKIKRAYAPWKGITSQIKMMYEIQMSMIRKRYSMAHKAKQDMEYDAAIASYLTLQERRKHRMFAELRAREQTEQQEVWRAELQTVLAARKHASTIRAIRRKMLWRYRRDHPALLRLQEESKHWVKPENIDEKLDLELAKFVGVHEISANLFGFRPMYETDDNHVAEGQIDPYKELMDALPETSDDEFTVLFRPEEDYKT